MADKIECPECNGEGRVVCCIAYDVEGVGGPHGCRCAPTKRGYSRCPGCDGTGEIEMAEDEMEKEERR